jgi:hypothetical protein
MNFQGTTRTKPYVRLSRIRLPPRVFDCEAWPNKIRLVSLIGCCLNDNRFFRVALINEGHGFSRASSHSPDEGFSL